MYITCPLLLIHPDATMYALAFQLDEKDFNTFEKHEFRYVFREVQASCEEFKKKFLTLLCVLKA